MESVFDFSFSEAFPIHRLDTEALVLYGLLNLIFLIYYGWRYYKEGIFTFDTYFVIMSLYIPIVFMFPFAFSEINSILATGQFHEIYLGYLHDAFYICVVGIACFIVGAGVSKVTPIPLPGLKTLSWSLHRFWLTRLGLGFGILLVLFLLLLMVALGFEIGNARATAMQNPSLRPIYNLFHTLVSFVALNVLVYGYSKSRKWYYLLGVMVAFIGAFGGTRGASIMTLVDFFVIVLICSRYRNFLVPMLAALIFLPLVVYLGGVRHGIYDLSQVMATPFVILYGNNFSDLRDFAWILSGWDHVLVYGRTQLAGFLSFIPSSLSEFRATWAWGEYSTITAGLTNTEAHPGLRPTIFGETFFNYGYFGVAVIGFLAGFVVYKLSIYVSRSINTYGAKQASVNTLGATVYMALVTAFLITAGFFAFHIILIAMIAGVFVFSAVKHQRSLTKEKVLADEH